MNAFKQLPFNILKDLVDYSISGTGAFVPGEDSVYQIWNLGLDTDDHYVLWTYVDGKRAVITACCGDNYATIGYDDIVRKIPKEHLKAKATNHYLHNIVELSRSL